MSHRLLILALSALLLTGCASWFPQQQRTHNASLVEFLYPKSQNPAAMQVEQVATLNLPLRVGIAFVPSLAGSSIPEAERMKMLERVRGAFSGLQYVSAIEIIPSTYLRPAGGFANLEQAARMFNLDAVALLSYDQVQFNDSNELSLLYWTIIGMYVIHGDMYDINTLLDASLFDVKSSKLLMRAPGVSQVKGSAALVRYEEKARQARVDGFNMALDDLMRNFNLEIAQFKERVKGDASIKIEHRPGYAGGGDGLLPLLLGLGGLLLVGMRRRWRG